MVSKLKSLSHMCDVFMCCMPDSLDNVNRDVEGNEIYGDTAKEGQGG